MLEQPKFGMTVVFRPPENAYSTTSRQHHVSGLVGTLLAWNGLLARIRINNEKRQINPDFLTPQASAFRPGIGD